MKFSIPAGQFLKPLQLALASADTRSTLPILGNFLIQEHQGGISITGCNLETELRTFAPAEVESAGGMTLGAQKLVNLVKQLPGDEVVSVSEINGRATIKAGRSRFTLSTLPVEHYPAFPLGDIKAEVSLPASVLAGLTEAVSASMGVTDVRYYLNGMFLEVKGGVMRAVASDGHRLSMAKAEVEAEDVPGFIIPRATVLRLSKLLVGNIALSLASNAVKLDVGAFSYASKLVEGQYPNPERVTLKEADVVTRLTLNREALIEAITRVKVLAEKDTGVVVLEHREGELHISLTNAGDERANDSIPAEIWGEMDGMSFNPNYLLDALHDLPSEWVELAFSKSYNQARLKVTDSDAVVHVIMPMRM